MIMDAVAIITILAFSSLAIRAGIINTSVADHHHQHQHPSITVSASNLINEAPFLCRISAVALARKTTSVPQLGSPALAPRVRVQGIAMPPLDALSQPEKEGRLTCTPHNLQKPQTTMTVPYFQGIVGYVLWLQLPEAPPQRIAEVPGEQTQMEVDLPDVLLGVYVRGMQVAFQLWLVGLLDLPVACCRRAWSEFAQAWLYL